jgi:hypothetical protein
MNKTHILDEIRRTTEENIGVPLGRSRFLAKSGIRESDWVGKFWSKWSDAVKLARGEPNKKPQPFDEGWLLGKLAGLVRGLGHYTVAAEL